MKKYSFLLFFFILISGCNSTKYTKEKLFEDGILIKIDINKVEKPKQKNEIESLVYANLSIVGGNPKIKSINLDCISLLIGNRQSEQIYIDSVAHILTSDYSVKNNTVSVDVYWSFQNIVNPDNLSSFDFVFSSPKNGSCVNFN
ncbi:MAG: hypothetical protein OCC45_11285 [Desulfotalea sp.]